VLVQDISLYVMFDKGRSGYFRLRQVRSGMVRLFHVKSG
jgi:hypothetical protein